MIHKLSYECASSELDLFATPPTQTSLEDVNIVEYKTIAPVNGTGPLEFIIPKSDTEYTDLSQTYLYVKCKLVKDKGEQVTAQDICAPVYS